MRPQQKQQHAVSTPWQRCPVTHATLLLRGACHTHTHPTTRTVLNLRLLQSCSPTTRKLVLPLTSPVSQQAAGQPPIQHARRAHLDAMATRVTRERLC
jgi:hypothetical protein